MPCSGEASATSANLSPVDGSSTLTVESVWICLPLINNPFGTPSITRAISAAETLMINFLQLRVSMAASMTSRPSVNRSRAMTSGGRKRSTLP